MNTSFLKSLLIIFVIITVIIFLTATPLHLHQNLLLGANFIYLLLSLLAYKIMTKPTSTPHQIINQMLAGTMLRLFIVGVGMGLIIYFFRMNISKLNYGFLFLMYIIYTTIESKFAMAQSKNK